jgi:hypothetical protein
MRPPSPVATSVITPATARHVNHAAVHSRCSEHGGQPQRPDRRRRPGPCVPAAPPGAGPRGPTLLCAAVPTNQPRRPLSHTDRCLQVPSCYINNQVLYCPTGPAGRLAGTGTDAATNGWQSDRDFHDSRQRADESAAQFAAARAPNVAPRRRVARGGAASNAGNPSHNRPPHTTTHTNTQPQMWSTYIFGQTRPPQHGLTP